MEELEFHSIAAWSFTCSQISLRIKFSWTGWQNSPELSNIWLTCHWAEKELSYKTIIIVFFHVECKIPIGKMIQPQINAVKWKWQNWTILTVSWTAIAFTLSLHTPCVDCQYVHEDKNQSKTNNYNIYITLCSR